MPLPDGWTSGTVSANGIDIHYHRTGDGPPIVMAHGMYDSGRRWVRLGETLAPEYETIAYDARGHGHSDAPEEGYDIETRVADLVGVIEGLDLSKPILLGHSMGATTVAWTASEHPDLPRGVVLVDPSRFRTEPDMSVAEAMEAGEDHLAELRSLSVEERIEQQYDVDDLDRDHRRRLAEAVDECSTHVLQLAQEHPLVKEAFDDITAPTLVLRRDVGVSERVADLEAADRLATGRLVHVPDAGHDVFLDAYDAATSELRTFLRRV